MKVTPCREKYSIVRGPDILFDNTLILLNNKMDICGCSKTQFPLINSRIGNVHLKTVSGSRSKALFEQEFQTYKIQLDEYIDMLENNGEE